MYRGRYQLGDEVPLGVLTRDASGLPAVADACPQIEIYGPSAKIRGGWLPGGLSGGGVQIPVTDKSASPGLFGVCLLLGSMFGAGLHTVTYRWTVAGYRNMSTDTFEILANGSDRGNVIALDYYPRPHADYLVMGLDSGRIRAGHNPRI